MEASIIDILIKGGQISIILVLLYLGWRKDQMYNKSLNNHFVHWTAAEEKRAESDLELAKAITRLSDKIDSCPIKKV